MEYKDFEEVLSERRTKRYLQACNGNGENAMRLYKLNMDLSEAMFSLINLMEVSLRNVIDRKMVAVMGRDWVVNSVLVGIWTDKHFDGTAFSVERALKELDKKYSHEVLLSNLTLGFWKYIFSPKNYNALVNGIIAIIVDNVDDNLLKDIINEVESYNYKSDACIIDSLIEKIGTKNLFKNKLHTQILDKVIDELKSITKSNIDITETDIDIFEVISSISGLDIVEVLSKNNKYRMPSVFQLIRECYPDNSDTSHKNDKRFKLNNRVNALSPRAKHVKYALRGFGTHFISGLFPNYNVNDIPDFSNYKNIEIDENIKNDVIYMELDLVTKFRNRIAHHDPICFNRNSYGNPYDIKLVQSEYNLKRILNFLKWIGVTDKMKEWIGCQEEKIRNTMKLIEELK